MYKKTKIFISLFFVFTLGMFFQTSFSKYVLEDIHVVAKLDIDRCKPIIEFTHITTSNIGYPTHTNKAYLIMGLIKITEKNIVRNDLSPDNIKVTVANKFIKPEFKSFSLISENATEKIYKFSFIAPITTDSLTIIIPKGIIEDKSGLMNESKTVYTNIDIT